MSTRIPRSKDNDYTREAAAARRQFVHDRTGATLTHVGSYSFDPAVLPGNVENFIGVAQVPIGLAGPLRIVGEKARGDFYIPLATSEGTLVASYNRGMRLLSESGGVKTTVVEQLIPMLRRNSGLKRKLSAEKTPVAMSSSAARCLAGETGVSGRRAVPA